MKTDVRLGYTFAEAASEGGGMTVFERIQELKAAGAVAALVADGLGCVDGDSTPEMYSVALGRSLGLRPEDVLALDVLLAEIIDAP